MSLGCDPSAKFPCTRCLIPNEKQGVYPIVRAVARTSAEAQEIVLNTRQLTRSSQKEEILKSFGLRDVDVCPFFSFIFSLLLTNILTECFLENRELGPV